MPNYSGGEAMKRLTDLKFLITVLAVVCVEYALIVGRIDANTYSVLISLSVGGFLAADWKAESKA